MDKRSFTSLMGLIVTLTVALSACSTSAATPATTPEAPQPTASLKDLPPELEIPSVLPEIRDPELLEAWIRLYNRPGPIFQWDGSLLTGKGLAQFIVDHAIPILWDREKKCHGGACSIRYCDDRTCTYDGPYPGADPIYIPPILRDDPRGLEGTLAHEIYHRLEPFGDVRDTLFEEYCAYGVEAQITHATWPVFGMQDPLVPDQLVKWFQANQLSDYHSLQVYPAAVASSVKSNRQGLPLAGANPGLDSSSEIQSFK